MNTAPATATPHPASTTSNSDPTPNSASQHADSPRSKHRGKGNVARLPKNIRDQVGHWILDGVPYHAIITKLGEHGRGLSVNNISNWKTDGGYGEFLEEQRLLEQCRLRREFFHDLATEDSGTESYQASPKILVALACQAFMEMGPDTLRRALKESPMNAFRLLNSLSRLLSGGLRCEQHLLDAAERKSRLPSQPDPEKGLSPEVLSKLIHGLSLM